MAYISSKAFLLFALVSLLSGILDYRPFANGKPVNDGSDKDEDEDDTGVDASPDGPVGPFDYVDVDDLEAECSEIKNCPASEKYFLVCGSDGVVYKNIGVLACAQKCNKGLKIKDFGPCEGVKVLTSSSTERNENITTTTPTTLVNYHGFLVDPKTQKNISSDELPDILGTLKLRIKARIGDYYHLSPKWEKWCRENEKDCYYGFDPNYNPAMFLTPTDPYTKQDVLAVRRSDEIKRYVSRLSGGFTSSSTPNPNDKWF